MSKPIQKVKNYPAVKKQKHYNDALNAIITVKEHPLNPYFAEIEYKTKPNTSVRAYWGGPPVTEHTLTGIIYGVYLGAYKFIVYGDQKVARRLLPMTKEFEESLLRFKPEPETLIWMSRNNVNLAGRVLTLKIANTVSITGYLPPTRFYNVTKRKILVDDRITGCNSKVYNFEDNQCL